MTRDPELIRHPLLLERVLFKWKRFDGRDFSCQPGEHRSIDVTSAKDFDAAGAEKIAKPVRTKMSIYEPQSFEAWFFAPWTSSREANGPRTASLHASSQDTNYRRSNDSN